jgi:broad specificity phosphatase PhoE
VLYVVRHGETAPNVAGVFLGRADPPLTPRGVRQAAWLAASLPPADRVISSPLQRARRTADAFGAPVEVDERWIELDYGALEGVHPNSVPQAARDRWHTDISYRPDGGESLSELGERVRAACDDLAYDAIEKTVVVVTHVSPVKAAVAWALDVEDTVAGRLWVDDAGVARIEVGPEGPVLCSLNEHRSRAP